MKDALKKIGGIKLLLAIMMLALMVGCIGTKNTTKTLYASLDSATAVYNSTYELVKELGAMGKLTYDQKVEIKSIMTDVEDSLVAATDVLALYVDTQSEEDRLSFETNILAINQLVIKITEIIGGT